MEVMQTEEPTANPANSPTCMNNTGKNNVRINDFTEVDKWQSASKTAAGRLTALVSVATARVTNIMLKVTTTSMTSACQCGPTGSVVPITVMGWSTALSTKDAQIAPVNCAAQ